MRSSSREVISVIEDAVVSDEGNGKGKGKAGITPAKPSDISNCMVVDSDGKKVHASSWLYRISPSCLTLVSQCQCLLSIQSHFIIGISS